MSTTYTVSVGSFEGPFDLLLHLIARRQLDIHEIPIAQITDDYLAVLRTMEQVDLEVTTEFLVVATTLLELKAARLLPGEDDPELEETALEVRDLLYARLLDYRTFKEAAGWIGARLTAHSGYLPRDVGLEAPFTEARPAVELGVDAETLARIAARAFAERPGAEVDVSHLQPVRMTVGEAADLVVGELRRAGGKATFAEVTAGCRHRIERIMCFLAVLELYKHEVVEVGQARTCGEIVVTGLDLDAPTQATMLDAYEGRAAEEPDPAEEPDLVAGSDPDGSTAPAEEPDSTGEHTKDAGRG